MRAWALPIVVLVGCQAAPWEGEHPGDCEDGADNDRDGLFDCRDDSCVGAPACDDDPDAVVPGDDRPPVVTEDPDPDPDPDLDPDPDPDPGPTPAPFVHDPLVAVTVELRVTFDLDELGDALCGLTTICDCAVEYTGAGAFLAGQGTTATFEGTWAVSGGDCSALSGFATVVWNRPANPAAFHTFTWSTDGARLERWVVHRDAEDTTPTSGSANQAGQFWIDGLRAPWDPSTLAVHHEESQAGRVDLISVSNEFTLDLRFE